MEWLKRLFNIFSSSTPIDQTTITFKPPWVLHPKYPPGDGFWRQSGESDMSAWLTNWQSLSHSERQSYIQKWNVPDQWKRDFFQDTVIFHDWVYGIACENIESLSTNLFAGLVGQTVDHASFTENAGLSMIISQPEDSSSKSTWHIKLQRAAWQLYVKGKLQAASLDDPVLIEQELAILKNAKIEKISSTPSYHELTMACTGDIKFQTFITQAFVDIGDIDQWKIYTPDNTVLCSGSGSSLRYEISEPLTF